MISLVVAEKIGKMCHFQKKIGKLLLFDRYKIVFQLMLLINVIGYEKSIELTAGLIKQVNNRNNLIIVHDFHFFICVFGRVFK